MNDFLNEDKLRYDSPRYKEMEAFLNRIHKIVKFNPSKELNSDMVYGELEKCTLKLNDYNFPGIQKRTKHLYDKWIKDFETNPNIAVFNHPRWKYWCQFTNKDWAEQNDNHIKIYIPINAQGIETAVPELFKFLAQHKIKHESKVAGQIRNDNVVIRLNRGDEKSLRMIIDFVNNSPKIKPYLNKTNPFVPCIDGIGVMNDSGGSYNKLMASLMFEYVQKHKKDLKIDLDDFLKYAREQIRAKEMRAALDNAVNKEQKYFDPNEDIFGDVLEESLTEGQKRALVNEAIRTTYEKYGYNQAVGAIKMAVQENDFGYFTNDNGGYRDLLIKYIGPEELERIIDQSTIGAYKSSYQSGSIIFKAEDYCSYYIEDGMVHKLDEMCTVTLENYGGYQLVKALEFYRFSGQTHLFSRFKKGDTTQKNYRENSRFIPPSLLHVVIRKSLKLKGIEPGTISDEMLPQVYADTLGDPSFKIRF